MRSSTTLQFFGKRGKALSEVWNNKATVFYKDPVTPYEPRKDPVYGVNLLSGTP
jgi:hypothetical protein